jgi:hypothetical protein
MKKEPTEALNLMFYDFNNSSAATNPYENADPTNRRCFSKGGDRLPTRERGFGGTRQQNLRRSILLSRGDAGGSENR